MQQQTVTMNNPSGLHARPGKDFVQLAKSFESNIVVRKGDKEYNGKSLLKLMQAGIAQNDAITIVADGSDEQEALQALVRYISELEE